MTTKTIKEIENLLNQKEHLNSAVLTELAKDPRKGVQKLLARYYQRQKRQEAEYLDHQTRFQIETQLYLNGDIEYIAGIDEVGRGPLAGPIVAACVILPKSTEKLIGVNDSKTLNLKKRETLADIIKREAIAYSIFEIDNKTIDKVNIYRATQQAMLKSVRELSIKPSYLLVDAMTLDVDIPQKSVIKGDQRSLSIGAASILAKVHRDQLMQKYHELYPEFNFKQNMGYGTQEHLQALEQYGYTPIHRRSFAPISQMTQIYHP